MRTILVLLLLSICIILMVGIYIQQPRLFGDTTTVINTPIIATTYTPLTNPVIDLQNVKSTQTAIANEATGTAVPSAATTVSKVLATIQPTTLKPARLPDTGSADSSDIWDNTPIMVLIGICVLLSIGLYLQNRRALK